LPTVSPKQIPQEIASPQQRNVLTSPSEAIEDIHASVLNENHIFNGPIPTTATKIREQARAANRAAGVIEKLSPMDLSPYLSLEMIDLPVLGPYMLNNGATYLGQFMHGLKHGRGRMVFPDGSVFEGIFKKDLFDGFGRLVTADACMYEGEWSNHLQTGNGVERGEEGTKYEGEFLDNKYHGWGQLESKPWAYSGYFKGGLFEGEGTLQFPDKSTYQGAFLQGKPHGPGLFTWPDREKYIGEYRMGKKHGSGTMHYKDGSKYQGRFEAGLPQGEGTFTDKDGTAHAGKWAKGKLIK
jgi:hypothetical protein